MNTEINNSEKDKNKIFIYNTLGRELQEFVPIDKIANVQQDTEVKNTEIKRTEIKMYHCGPTVYWDQHIGNMRAVVLADLIKRSIEYNTDKNGNNYKVTLVRNYTDVGHLTGDNIGDADTGEDKMDKAARRDGKSPDEIADFYIKRYLNDIKLLNADSATYTPRATEYINQIIEMVSKLLDKGFAYTTTHGVYFNVAKYPEYTRLSGQKLELQNVGTGHGDVSDSQKINSADFALWIFKVGSHADALQTWESPFKPLNGEVVLGFPGWHMECSAMSKALLGKHFDIHMGGIEHIPVHHTNEIAQSQCANGEKYVNYWLHNEHLLIDNKKMSKSEGTAYFVRDVIKFLKENTTPTPALPQGEGDTKYAFALRYFFLQAHYRSKQNFTWEALLASYTAYIKLLKETGRLKTDLSLTSPRFGEESLKIQNTFKEEKTAVYKNKFLKAINKDFNISMALGIMWSMIKDKEVSTKDKLDLINDFNKVFGLFLE